MPTLKQIQSSQVRSLMVVLSPPALLMQVENVEILALALKLVQLEWDHWGNVLLHWIGSWIPRFQVLLHSTEG